MLMGKKYSAALNFSRINDIIMNICVMEECYERLRKK